MLLHHRHRTSALWSETEDMAAGNGFFVRAGVKGEPHKAGFAYCLPATSAKRTLMLVPGDITARASEMERDPNLGSEYSAFSFEALGALLSSRAGPECHTVVICPTRRGRCHAAANSFDAYVASNDDGDPRRYDATSGTAGALLFSLLRACEAECGGGPGWHTVSFLAFSKGAVVLNQFLTEVSGSVPSASPLVEAAPLPASFSS